MKKENTKYFTTADIVIWGVSVTLITVFFLIFDRSNYLTLFTSLLGAASLIFNAKGNPFGQFLMIIFGIIYAVISFECAYYGEMITYAGMTAPMALFSLIAWLRHPFNKNRSEVSVNKLCKKDVIQMSVLTLIVTSVFYFILDCFNTAELFTSTLSVTTSFAAVYLTFKRSEYFALAYAANDIVLIILWTLASFENIHYVSVTMCFASFLLNDIYGFISWRKMYKRQQSTKNQ